MAYQTWKDAYKQVVLEHKGDMTAISSWKKKLKDVKGLTKQQIQMLSTLPTPVITQIINQIGMVVADMSEAKYTNVHNKIKRIKNLNRKDADMISSIDPAVLGQVVKALAPMFEQTVNEFRRYIVKTPRGEVRVVANSENDAITRARSKFSASTPVRAFSARLESVNEGKRTDGATSFMFKNGPDSKKFLAYAKDFRKAERYTMNGLFFVDVYDVNKPVAIKLAKYQQQFWKESVNEDYELRVITRKHKIELQRAKRKGDLTLSKKAEEDLYNWAVDNGEIDGREEDEFIDWLDDNLDALVKGTGKL